MTKRRIHAEPIPRWTAIEEAQLVAMYPDMKTAVVAAMLGISVKRAYAKANAMGLTKSPAFLATPASGRTNGRQGIGSRFVKGQESWNAGTKGVMKRNRTSFQPGVRQGVAVKLWKPVGTERVSKDGYLERKVNDGLPLQRRWRAVHLIVWEAAHGPLPKGHAVSFKNGDKRDVSLGNLFLVTRADLMRRNTVHNYPQPIPQLVQLRGALQRQINRRQGNGRKED